MAARGREKEPPDLVHQNQIFCETVRKELRCQKLHTEYGVNPLKRVHTITRKPMSWHDNIEEPADAKFLNLIHHAALEPTKKYTEPQTESQEIGWNNTPLNCIRMDESLTCTQPGSKEMVGCRVDESCSLCRNMMLDA
ncbi:cilia- and flagella-associated protein 144 isoform X1 [Caretta caretta]|uniref:cilia- and flagella-associated protein 144 isoform X1 n=1 Tax=Caretta caretta TaxID=8467 RepID=UPI0020962A9D|nr:protein FAM183A isoform X1 [Caretta caretta]